MGKIALHYKKLSSVVNFSSYKCFKNTTPYEQLGKNRMHIFEKKRYGYSQMSYFFLNNIFYLCGGVYHKLQ